MSKKTTKEHLAEIDRRVDDLAEAIGNALQAQGGGTNGFRRVAPPDDESSPGQVGDFATDDEYAYFYLGNGTTHKWGQSLLITQFIR